MNTLDDWLLGAISIVMCHTSLVREIVGRCSPEYGIYEFQLCIDGIWRSIIIDDKIPIKSGSPLFCSGNKLAILLEKAYAKMRGGYENLKEGSRAAVLTEFTGGTVETIDPQVHSNLWKLIHEKIEQGYFLF